MEQLKTNINFLDLTNNVNNLETLAKSVAYIASMVFEEYRDKEIEEEKSQIILPCFLGQYIDNSLFDIHCKVKEIQEEILKLENIVRGKNEKH